jgi:protein-tyrosine phosphatase
MEHGIDISEQRSRKITTADLKHYDKIYAMAADVYRDIQTLAASKLDTDGMKKVDLFLNELYPGCNGTVPDPWYGPEEGYKDVFDLIDKTTTSIVKKYASFPAAV